MKIRIEPSRPDGYVYAPPSKSMAHRLLICAGLAEGTSRIQDIALSEDILATADCLDALGAEFRYDGYEMKVTGTDPASAPPASLRCRESGSTLRFLIPVCALSESTMRLTGSGRLMARPLSVYEDIFLRRGLLFSKDSGGVMIQGPLSSAVYELDASVSSQFISGMLFALPLVKGDSIIRLMPPIESRSYIDMTLAAMKRFGVTAQQQDDMTLIIPGRQKYSPADMVVEGDWSNAAFLLAMGADVRGLDPESLQGDKVCTDYFRALDEGAAELDITDCPDLGPVLMAYAALRHGARLTGTRRLRYKESDRGKSMKEELEKFGVPVEVDEDSITAGCGALKPSRELNGHNDHRIVMALSVMCAHTGGVIRGAEAVNKSWPGFFDSLRELGISAEETAD